MQPRAESLFVDHRINSQKYLHLRSYHLNKKHSQKRHSSFRMLMSDTMFYKHNNIVFILCSECLKIRLILNMN